MTLTSSRLTRGALALALAAAALPAFSQPVESSVKLSDVGMKATRLADAVYVNAEDLVLLQVFSSPPDLVREKRAKQSMATTMTALDALSTASSAKAREGALPRAVAQFVDDERAAARAVVSTQQAALSIRAEEAKPHLLAMGRYSSVLNELYGKLPGPSGTPDFYLGLLTWARKGFPPVRQEAKVDPALTSLEAYMNKLKQLQDPSGHAFIKKFGLNATDLKNKNILKNAGE